MNWQRRPIVSTAKARGCRGLVQWTKLTLTITAESDVDKSEYETDDEGIDHVASPATSGRSLGNGTHSWSIQDSPSPRI